MKKLLLSVAALAVCGVASAQLNGTGDGYVMDNLNASSQCLINAGVPNNGGIMNGDGSTLVGASSQLTASGLVLTSVSGTIAAGGTPTWFSLPYIVGSGPSAQCSTLNGGSEGIDMTNSGKVRITFSADVANAVLELFLGGSGQWSPSSSTYNTGSGDYILASVTASATPNTPVTLVVDYAALDATIWAAWAGRNEIQSVGFRSATGDAVFTVTKVEFGVEAVSSVQDLAANGVSVFPNPVTNGRLNFSEVISNVQIFDMVGNLVATANNTNSVDLTGVNAGVYFVRSSVGNAKVIVK